MASLMRSAVPFAVLFSALVFAAPVGAQTRPTDDPRAFAESVLPKMRKAYPGATLTISADDSLQITVAGGEFDGAYVNLHRIFGYCQQAVADECNQVTTDFLARISQPLVEAELANLRVLVRDQQYVDYIRLNLPADAYLAPRQIGDDLFAMLAIDSAETIAIASADDLQTFAVSEDEAWQLALTQTRAITPPLPEAESLLTNISAFVDFEYLPSLLYPAEAWSELAQKVGPNLFVAAISDGFVVAGVIEAENLAGLAEVVANDCATAERCVSPNVYRWHNGRWVIAER